MNRRAIRQPNHFQQISQVVRDERVTAPLRKETQHYGDEKPAAHACRSDEGHPGGGGALLGLALEGEGGVDLGDFGLDEF